MSLNTPDSGDVHVPTPGRKRRRMKKFRLDEISLVDRPAQTPARIAITKRQDEDYDKKLLSPRSGESEKDFVSRFMANEKAKSEYPDAKQRAAVAHSQFSKRMALTSMTDGHAHLIVGVSAHTGELSELRSGQTSMVDGHSHDWVMDDAGNIIIADSQGHTHGISVLVQKAEDFMNLIPEEGILADLFRTKQDGETTKAANSGSEAEMTEQNDAVDQAAKLDAITKRAERAEAVVSLSPDHRAHFETLSGNEQDEFLAKSSDERSSILKNLRDSDPVVYKSRDGDEFRKSDDPRIVKAAQRADKAEERAEKQEALAKRASFEKRADDELSHLQGGTDAKADLLEAVESLPVEKRDAVMTILKSKDAGMAEAMKRRGTSGAPESNSDESTIEGIAKRLREQDPSLTPAAAYTKALETPEGLEAFARLRN